MTPEAIVSEAPDYDDAQQKLTTAGSVIHCLAMLACTGDMDGLKKDSLSTTLPHAEELIAEAKQMFRHLHEAQAAGGAHGG